MSRKENRELSDQRVLIERAWPVPNAKEKKALRWLKKPIRLKANRPLTLTHHRYRGPWHLVRKGHARQMETPIRGRIQGPTPTRFVICSPDLLKKVKEEEKALPPYRGKPIVLKNTSGIRINFELRENRVETNAANLFLQNKGVSLKAEGMRNIWEEENWPHDTLVARQNRGILIALPEDHQTILTTEDGTTIFLIGKDTNQFIFSFTTQARKG